LIRHITLLTLWCGGVDTNICTWTMDRTPLTMLISGSLIPDGQSREPFTHSTVQHLVPALGDPNEMIPVMKNCVATTVIWSEYHRLFAFCLSYPSEDEGFAPTHGN